MRSSRLVVSLCLVLAAAPGFGQNKSQTDAEQDGLAGAVKSVSTIVASSAVKWEQPSGPTLVIPAYCRDCEYTADGHRTATGQVIDGKFVGEKISLNRDANGRVTDLLVTNTITGGLARREIYGPYGKTEQTIYQDGKVAVHQTFRYDGSGNLLETVSRDREGVLLNRTLSNRTSDGGWWDETWGRDEQVEAMNSYNPAIGEQRSTTFDESGNVAQAWTFTKGQVTSFWESSGAGNRGITVSDFDDKANVKASVCRGSGPCDQAMVHYEYGDPAKHNPVSAEWRDTTGNVLYGAYYTYQFDQSGNWTQRQVWVSTNTGERVLYETDNRLITYWEN